MLKNYYLWNMPIVVLMPMPSWSLWGGRVACYFASGWDRSHTSKYRLCSLEGSCHCFACIVVMSLPNRSTCLLPNFEWLARDAEWCCVLQFTELDLACWVILPKSSCFIVCAVGVLWHYWYEQNVGNKRFDRLTDWYRSWCLDAELKVLLRTDKNSHGFQLVSTLPFSPARNAPMIQQVEGIELWVWLFEPRVHGSMSLMWIVIDYRSTVMIVMVWLCLILYFPSIVRTTLSLWSFCSNVLPQIRGMLERPELDADVFWNLCFSQASSSTRNHSSIMHQTWRERPRNETAIRVPSFASLSEQRHFTL